MPGARHQMYRAPRLPAYAPESGCFPGGVLTRHKRHFGFQTGDLVKPILTKGKNVGVYMGRVAARAMGSFNIQTALGVVQETSHRHYPLIQRWR